MASNLELVNSFFTAISGVTAVIAIYLTTSQFKDSKKSDIKHFWYREFLLLSKLEDYNAIFDKILSLVQNQQSSQATTLLALKDCFENLREIFYKTEFFDKIMYNKIYNFINLCEQECLINQNLSKEEVQRMSNILLQSLYQYELNEYKNFEIKY